MRNDDRKEKEELLEQHLGKQEGRGSNAPAGEAELRSQCGLPNRREGRRYRHRQRQGEAVMANACEENSLLTTLFSQCLESKTVT